MSQSVRDGKPMSQTAINIELPNLPEVEDKPAQFFGEDSPCPFCGMVCPNDAYCINCGYVYDPVLKKYLTLEQTEVEKGKEKKPTFMVNRNSDGSFKDLPKGGHTKYSSMIVKIGKEYKRQNGRAAKSGDIVRRKNYDGSYNKGSVWYIRTPKGWTRSPSKKRKPTKAQIKRVCRDSKVR